MQFIYTCKDGPNEELRYSIRSLIKNFPNPDIVVVGGKPDWYHGAYIKTLQQNGRYKNVLNNLYEVANNVNIDNNFILMNDDFFILQPMTEVKVYNGGLLNDKVELYKVIDPSSSYTKNLIKLNKYVKTLSKQPIDYDIHVPMPLEKEKVIKCIDNNKQLLFRSVYGNMFNLGGETIEDVKFYNKGPLVKKTYDINNLYLPFLSSAPSSFDFVYSFILKDMFDKSSIYEKD